MALLGLVVGKVCPIEHAAFQHTALLRISCPKNIALLLVLQEGFGYLPIQLHIACLILAPLTLDIPLVIPRSPFHGLQVSVYYEETAGYKLNTKAANLCIPFAVFLAKPIRISVFFWCWVSIERCTFRQSSCVCCNQFSVMFTSAHYYLVLTVA